MQRWPIITDHDRKAVARVLDRGVLSGAGAPEMRALEAEFAATLGGGQCLATNSGTSALHIAIGALGLRPGDEVIVPAFSFIATLMSTTSSALPPRPLAAAWRWRSTRVLSASTSMRRSFASPRARDAGSLSPPMHTM